MRYYFITYIFFFKTKKHRWILLWYLVMVNDNFTLCVLYHIYVSHITLICIWLHCIRLFLIMINKDKCKFPVEIKYDDLFSVVIKQRFISWSGWYENIILLTSSCIPTTWMKLLLNHRTPPYEGYFSFAATNNSTRNINIWIAVIYTLI